MEVKRIRLLQLTNNREFKNTFRLFIKDKKNRYVFILGREFLQEIGLYLLHSQQNFECDGIKVTYVPHGNWNLTVIQEFRNENRPTLDSIEEKTLVTQRHWNTLQKRQENRYVFILGRDFLHEIGLDLLNSHPKFEWYGIKASYVPRGHCNSTIIQEFRNENRTTLDPAKEKSLVIQRYWNTLFIYSKKTRKTDTSLY